MARWRGKWALITGASAGIGKALAEQLASTGTNLVLTARRRDRLEELAKVLAAAHSVRAEVFAADLGRPSGPAEIVAFTEGKGIAVDLLVNNAGFGAYGEFAKVPRERQLEMVQVNIASVVDLTHRYLPAMIGRRSGDILIVASTAGFQPVPYISVYAATKAFDLLFAEGLAEEVRRYGIRVCALCPGSTTSEFHEVAGQSERMFGKQESAEKVARVGLAALAAGKSSVISGFRNRMQTESQRLVPRWFVARVAGKMYAPVD